MQEKAQDFKMKVESAPSEFETFDEPDTAGSSSGDDGETTNDASTEEQLASKETRAVFRLRAIVFATLFTAASIVSVVVFVITKNAEKDDFETLFAGGSVKLVRSFEEIVEQKIGALNSLSIAFTSYARNQNDTWPFVTMNDFQQRAASARSLSDSLFLEFLPVITDETRDDWETYSVKQKAWLDDGRAYQNKLGYDKLWEGGLRRLTVDGNVTDGSFLGDNVVDFVAGEGQGDSYIADKIWRFDSSFSPIRDPGPGPYYPIWQSSPILASPRDLVNWNLLDYPDYASYTVLCHESGDVTIGGIDTAIPGDITSETLATSFFAFILSYAAGKNVGYQGDPFSSVYIPVYDSYDNERKTVGVLVSVMRWATFFEDILSPNSEAVTIVLENTIEGAFTYLVTPTEAIFQGKGDLHDTKYDHMVRKANFDNLKMETGTIAFKLNQSLNQYTIRVYPTASFEEAHVTFLPVLVTIAVGLMFVFTAIMFLFYDRIVERRQKLVMSTAERTNAIVTSLFPSQVRDRLMEGFDQSNTRFTGTTTKLRSFLDRAVETKDVTEDIDNVGMDDFMYKTQPIADFFAETTVMFGDIVGFTAWSSTRDPTQVFTLLETIYKGFDEIAARRKVFKVETVGDCYVAVCGLPDPRKDHALVMARFANECLNRMKVLTAKLEKMLGPDTGDLQMRIGLHSGPVTAGVLRGERSRFQLFGDTVNTASRVESTGRPSSIHISKETADLIFAAGKKNWIREREDCVLAKGKGELSTFWLRVGTSNDDSVSDASSSNMFPSSVTQEEVIPPLARTLSDDKIRRLVDWNTDALKRLLKDIVARRCALGKTETKDLFPVKTFHSVDQTVIDEVCEVIRLPHFETKDNGVSESSDNIELSREVEIQLKSYVGAISAMYSDNPFHNFEHASHVTMSAVKLLNRIVAPSTMDFDDAQTAQTQLHDHTYGITSDPLTQFACVLSALIHDADHPGVPNTQLVKEKHPLATAYNNKSVAEQNSIDLCWELLMDHAYADLRACIYTNASEHDRFRQLLVNSVMATDIMDKDLKMLRNHRWSKAFDKTTTTMSSSTKESVDRKATIVIEHLIQASDVSHTMQHWHVYRKWNERLFMEMYKAFKQGRSDKNPATFWAKGEIGFFDFYIIPLAKKLKDCGVFGVSSDEYLNYAIKNRQEWEAKGESIVAELMEKVQAIKWEEV